MTKFSYDSHVIKGDHLGIYPFILQYKKTTQWLHFVYGHSAAAFLLNVSAIALLAAHIYFSHPFHHLLLAANLGVNSIEVVPRRSRN